MKSYTFTEAQLDELLNATIAMFIEYRDVHDKPEESAAILAVGEMFEGLDAIKQLVEDGELDKAQAGMVL